MSEILGSKVVNEGIEAAIQAAQTERQFVGHVDRLLIEESQHTVSQQEDVVGSKAEGVDQENYDSQKNRSPFLGCLRLILSGKFAYDTDIAECCDTERKEEEDEHHAEEKSHPGIQIREHVFLQHVEACGNPKLRDVKGQVCGHQWEQSTQDQTPHEEAADDSNGLLLPGLSEQHGPDDAQVAVNSDGHHGQNGTVHIGVEDNGQQTAHVGSQFPVVSLELVGDLKGQGSAKGQVGEGEIYHEDDGWGLGGGAEDEEPHGKAISDQVDGSDDYVDDRDGNAGVPIHKQGQSGVVQLEAAGVPRHDWMGMASRHL